MEWPCSTGRKQVEIPPQFQAPSLAWEVICLVGLYFGVCTLLSFYAGLTALVFSLLLLLLAYILTAEDLERRYPSAPSLLLLYTLTVLIAGYVGIKNYHGFYAPYKIAMAGRTYQNVSANARASAFLDGGTISFLEDAVLDDTRTVGMIGFGHTYCVAPILSRSSSVAPHHAAPTAQFWAVGLDCCGARSDFECDSAGSSGDDHSGVRGGIVQHESEEYFTSSIFAPSSYREEYMRAIRAASALHTLPMAREPVLVRWVNHPDWVLHAWLTGALCVWGLSTVGYGIFISIVWCSIHNYYDRKIRKAVQAVMGASSGGAVNAPPGQRNTRDPFLLSSGGS